MQRERGAQRVRGVREPQQEPVAELLDDTRAHGQDAAHDALLCGEQRERVLVAPESGELGETDDVGEHDRPADRDDS
jgi:hypothetical protein